MGVEKDTTVKQKSPGLSGGYDWATCPECGVTLKSINILSHLKRAHPEMPDTERKEIARRRCRGGTGSRMGTLNKKANRASSMNRRKKNDMLIFGTLLSMLATIIGGYFYYELSEQHDYGEMSDNPNPTDTKKMAPDFLLQDASGTTFSLQSHKGRVIVLHFIQVLSDCKGTYFYKSDDRTGYDPSMSGYTSLTSIGTIHQFEELKAVSSNYPADKVEVISIIVPPGCCGDPLQFSQDFRNNYSLTWHVASDTMQYDTWYKYMEYLPSDSNRVFTRDPTILVLDKDMRVAYDLGYTDAGTLSSRINALL